MGFHNIQFPTAISRGSASGPGYKHQIIELPTGAEEIVATQSLPRWTFDVGKGVQNRAQANELVRFYTARGGIGNSFRFKDPLDYTSNDDGTTAPTTADQGIGTGDGATLTFQLRKSYDDAAATVYRTITKPVAATTVIAVGGVAQVSPGWTYPWTCEPTTGLVTFTVAPAAAAAVTAGYEFDCEVRFGSALDEAFMVTHTDWENHSVQVPLMEKFPAAPVEDASWDGGAGSYAGSADVTLSKASGRDITFEPTGAYSVFLPLKAPLSLGGPHFYLHNTSGTNSLTIKDGDDSSTVGTLTNTAGVTPDLTITLGLTGGGARIWYALG